uniref:NADH-ubiquinone oxidoreductase chain 5 n=1 Tax=Histeromerus sp. QL-2013 TaxID=1421637 RepID=A0A0A6ZL04_9HYME|nr:NADH dehydrogenase subunit 5 [Histeromerus sp. QL-2013]
MFLLTSSYMFFMNLIFWMISIMMLLMKLNFIMEWNLYMFNSMKIEFFIYMDWMSMMFISTILLISSMVIIYSMEYMKNDLFLKRFMILIMIFVSSMIMMIISPNMISILLGWDGLGLSSYCLVAYYQNKKSFNSSMITILMNRIGDIMILILISLFMMFGSWNFMFFKSMNMIFMFFILIAAITKSAQIPFSTWLPLAMAAPTPISSLVHSSTLVTTGIYLLIRFNFLMNNNFLYFLMMLSSLTMLLAGSSANFEFDLKKIIALSTLSQLGLMILTISINLPKLAFFHLITHAMFKSLLFLCSGIIIHNYMNNQDIRYISFMNMNMPFINLTFNIASLTLCGMPFLTGFYSKDMIIEMFLMNYNNLIIFLIMFLSMMFTIMYSFRLLFYISIKNLKMNMFMFYNSFNLMNYSIIILLLLSIFYGSTLNWLLYSSLNNIFLPSYLKLLIFKFLFMGLIISLMIQLIKLNFYMLKMFKTFYTFMNLMWFLPLLFKKNKMNILNLNNKLIFYSDMGWLEMLSSKKIIFYLNILYKMKNIFKMNFLLMTFLSIYLIIFMIYM